MNVLTHISLNFQQPNYLTVYAAQNDRLSRYINAQLLDGSEPWTLPTGGLMTVRYRKPDGTSGFYDTLEDGSPAYNVETDGSITFGLAEQALTVPGAVPVELNFYNAAGSKLSTLTFIVAVKPSAYSDEDIASSDYYNILTAKMQELAELSDQAEGDYQEYLSALSAFVGAPRTAPTAADMLDTNLVYVYTGNETGYTYGDWYYYNGREWVSGGVYNSAAISLDATLTNADKPAQAKAAGDLVLVQDTQPTDTVNKLWFPLTDPEDVQVPTMEEFNNLKSSLNDVYIGKPIEIIGINKLNPAEIEVGIRIGDDGSETAYPDDDSTGFIELDTTKTSVAFTGKNAGGTARVCLPINHILFFANDKTTVISHRWFVSSNTVVEIPTNAVYTRMSVGHDHMTSRQPMVEFVDSTSEISPVYVAYNEVVERSHGLNYIDETQKAILVRLDAVEDAVDDFGNVSEQVDANTASIADILGTPHTIDKLATFTDGGIRSTTGEFVGSYTYRVATPNIVTLSKKVTFTIESGYRLYVARFLNGVFQSAGWVSNGTVLDAGTETRFMVARTNEDQSEVADVALFCSKVTYIPDGSLSDINEQVDENTEAIATLESNVSVVTYGLTWDWWITCDSVDTFGNAYIGYVDTDGYAGIIRRQPDGVMQYKRLEKLANDDDHNACATVVLDDGRILVIGSYGHTVNNHIICWRSVNPCSIDEMEKLSFDLPQTGGYTYKTCYSQVIKYNGKLFDFMRFGSIPSGSTSGTYGFACLISTDNGSTWTPYKVFNGTDAYNAIAQCTDDDKYIKIIVADNPGGGANTFRGCYIDLSTYAIYDLSDSQIGTMVPLNNGPITDSSCAQKADMTALIPQTQSGLMGRLFFTAQTPKANTVFLFATALDTAGTDFKYKRYFDGTVVELGNSGVGFGNVHYISGACFGKDIDTIYYAKATTAMADGPHELHKVKVTNNAVDVDEIITEASMCILRPLFLGNGELATVVGHYNDQNSDGTYNGSFTAWELKPLFTGA